jgi:hypothetical protein
MEREREEGGLEFGSITVISTNILATKRRIEAGEERQRDQPASYIAQ